MYKSHIQGGPIPTPGPEYYNNSIHWEGVYIDLVQDIVKVRSQQDILLHTYTNQLIYYKPTDTM